MRVRIDKTKYGLMIVRETNKGQALEAYLVQCDYEYPAWAAQFGWQPCHKSTDGTIDCPECGKSTGQFINEAYDYLVERDGESIEDDGVFARE